jgi:hypothetical protein
LCIPDAQILLRDAKKKDLCITGRTEIAEGCEKMTRGVSLTQKIRLVSDLVHSPRNLGNSSEQTAKVQPQKKCILTTIHKAPTTSYFSTRSIRLDWTTFGTARHIKPKATKSII